MKKHKELVSVLFFSFFMENSFASEVYFVGASENEVKTEKMSLKDYQNVILETQKSFNSIIDDKDLFQKSKFKLKAISLGVGASFEIGIGPWKRGFGIRQRFFYQR